MHIKRYIVSFFFSVLMIVSVSIKSTDNNIDTITKSMNNWFTATGISNPSKGWELKVIEVNKSNVREMYKENCSQPNSPCPAYEVSILLKYPEGILSDVLSSWDILNKRAMEIEGATLDERIIFKLSYLLGVRADKIHVKYHTYSLSFEVMFIENKVKYINGKASKGAGAHKMAGASTLVTKKLSDKIEQSLVKLPQDSVSVSEIKGAEIASFIKKHYSSKNVSLRIVSEDNHYVSAIITGLESEVIPSETFWESIQISFLISDVGDSINLRTLVDGQYAAGLREPSTLAYIDMEPLYTKDLQKYASFILESVKHNIINGEVEND